MACCLPFRRSTQVAVIADGIWAAVGEAGGPGVQHPFDSTGAKVLCASLDATKIRDPGDAVFVGFAGANALWTLSLARVESLAARALAARDTHDLVVILAPSAILATMVAAVLVLCGRHDSAAEADRLVSRLAGVRNFPAHRRLVEELRLWAPRLGMRNGHDRSGLLLSVTIGDFPGLLESRPRLRVTTEGREDGAEGEVTTCEQAEFFAPDTPGRVSCVFNLPNGGAAVNREAWVCVEHRSGTPLVSWRVVAGVWRTWSLRDVAHAVPLPADFTAQASVLEGDMGMAAVDDDLHDQLAAIAALERAEAERVRARARAESGNGPVDGLDIYALRQLPTILYEPREDKDGGEVPEDKVSCVVCMVDFEKGDELRLLPCVHWFHKECADDWLMRKAICPFCNQELSL